MTAKTMHQSEADLRTVLMDLAARWEKEADGTQKAIDIEPLGGEIEAAQHERVRIYLESARDLREVLTTGRVPEDLLTGAELQRVYGSEATR